MGQSEIRALDGVLLVANQQAASASIVDLRSGAVTEIQVGPGPHETTISPDGRLGVVTVYGVGGAPGNKLAIVDMGTKAVVRTVDLGEYRRPHDVSFVPGAPNRVLVTSEASKRIVDVDIASGSVLGTVDTRADGSHMLALAGDARTLFSANVGSNSVSQLELPGRTFVRDIAVNRRPEGIAITPDGREVWVGSNDSGTVSVIATTSGQITHVLRDLGFPYRIAISPNGAIAAVADPSRNRLILASVATHQIIGEVATGGSPRGVDFAPDNRTAFVTLGPEGEVVVVDLAERRVTGRHKVGTAPDGVAWGRAFAR